MKLKKFEQFINEEISDEFLNKSINNAREKGRIISKGYEDSLRSKHSMLKDKNINTNKSKKLTDEDIEKLSYEIDKSVDNNAKFKIGSYDNLIFTISYYNRNLKFMFNDNDNMFKLKYNVDNDTLNLEVDGDEKPISTIMDVYSFLINIFKKYIPQSKYANRKNWSNLD